MNDETLTFGGYPVVFELVGDEVYITCKGLTGTLTQIGEYLKHKEDRRYFFGKAKIRTFPNKKVRVDCLEDTRKQLNDLYTHGKRIKNE